MVDAVAFHRAYLTSLSKERKKKSIQHKAKETSKEKSSLLPSDLDILTKIQFEDGRWERSPMLESAIGFSIPEMPFDCHYDWKWVTAFVVSYLKQFPKHFDDLYGAVLRASPWLNDSTLTEQAKEQVRNYMFGGVQTALAKKTEEKEDRCSKNESEAMEKWLRKSISHHKSQSRSKLAQGLRAEWNSLNQPPNSLATMSNSKPKFVEGDIVETRWYRLNRDSALDTQNESAAISTARVISVRLDNTIDLQFLDIFKRETDEIVEHVPAQAVWLADPLHVPRQSHAKLRTLTRSLSSKKHTGASEQNGSLPKLEIPKLNNLVEPTSSFNNLSHWLRPNSVAQEKKRLSRIQKAVKEMSRSPWNARFHVSENSRSTPILSKQLYTESIAHCNDRASTCMSRMQSVINTNPTSHRMVNQSNRVHNRSATAHTLKSRRNSTKTRGKIYNSKGLELDTIKRPETTPSGLMNPIHIPMCRTIETNHCPEETKLVEALTHHDRLVYEITNLVKQGAERYRKTVHMVEKHSSFCASKEKLQEIRLCALDVVDAVVGWRKNVGENATMYWNGRNCLIHILHSLDFLAGIAELVDWFGSYPFLQNPFAMVKNIPQRVPTPRTETTVIIRQDGSRHEMETSAGKILRLADEEALLEYHKMVFEAPSWWPGNVTEDLLNRVRKAEKIIQNEILKLSNVNL